MAQNRLKLSVVTVRIVWFKAVTPVLVVVEPKADIDILPGLAVRAVGVWIITAFVNLLAKLLAVILWCSSSLNGMMSTSNRFKLGVVAERIIRFEAVAVGFLVIEPKAHWWVLPAFAVGTVSVRIIATGLCLMAQLFAVSGRICVISSHKTDDT